MKTILITGCSSGFGLETARLFLERGWNVVATMRDPHDSTLPPSERLRVLPLDVTSGTGIRKAIQEAGPVDVLVNNAGIGLLGAVEGTTMETIRQVFETNTFGTIALTRAVLPQFRERRSGVIVNVTSTVTLIPLPLLAVYTASKAAVNAFTESLVIEMMPFGVGVHVVLPGRSPQTQLLANAQSRMEGGIPGPYQELARGIFESWSKQPADEVTQPIDVAEAVWRAATDPSSPVRIPAGVDAVALAGGQRA